MKKSSFVQQKRKEINSAIEFTIEQHLSVLNSEIILPTKQGRVNDLRLLATVTSRDNVYNNVVAFLDNPEIDPIVKEKSKGEILNGLKNTMDELIKKIIRRPLKVYKSNEESEEDNEDETSDDIISSVSNSVKKAVDLVILINGRIASIENPDIVKEKLESQKIPSIAERYAQNR